MFVTRTQFRLGRWKAKVSRDDVRGVLRFSPTFRSGRSWLSGPRRDRVRGCYGRRRASNWMGICGAADRRSLAPSPPGGQGKEGCIVRTVRHNPRGYIEIGCRIPKDYFWTIGWGESDVGIETGSYDCALTMAGIENFNVMLYTSVLPPEATEMAHLPDVHHGSVLEGIIAVQHTDRPGTRITAGLLLANVYRTADRSRLGGFACEYAGNGTVDDADANLRQAMRELFARRYSSSLYSLELGKIVTRTFTPTKRFGTILVGIAFASYLSPVLDESVSIAASHKDKSHVTYTSR